MKKHNHKEVEKLERNEFGVYPSYRCSIYKKVIRKGKETPPRAFGKAKILRNYVY